MNSDQTKRLDMFGLSAGYLERLSVAAREPIYSAAIAWLFDDYYSPLTIKERKSILNDLSGILIDDKCKITACTEWNNIDLLLTIEAETETQYLAIENKIKSFESTDQLKKYDEKLEKLTGHKIFKIFLTLTGEEPISGSGWNPVSYEKLLTAIRSQSTSLKNPFVDDICLAMQRLVEFTKATSENRDLASFAFGDREPPLVNSAQYTYFAKYIEKMKLTKVSQRIWMTNLVSALEVPRGWRVKIGESNGQALVNIEAELKDHPKFLVGIQIQNHSMKVFCVPDPYPKKVDAEQVKIVDEVLQSMQLKMSGGGKVSKPRHRGFSSFSISELPRNRDINNWVEQISPQLRHFVHSNNDSVVKRI
jgi:PD-(D/E)XK nuclease superfamily